MLVEILKYKSEPVSGCVTTSKGRLWADTKYYRDFVKTGPLQLEVPDEEGEILIAKDLVKEVRKPKPEPVARAKPKTDVMD